MSDAERLAITRRAKVAREDLARVLDKPLTRVVGWTAVIRCALDSLDALAAYQASQSEGEGEFVLVPREPTKAMLDAGCDQFRRSREAGNGFCYSLGPAYRAMLSAAPPAPGASGWRDISTVPEDDSLFLAVCADGRMMIWKGSIFKFQKLPTPEHLRFPATHWQPLPSPPDTAQGEG